MFETTEKAILAGDCFWGMQDLLRNRPDVVSTRVGYTGGDVPNPTYRHHGTHAEAIEIVFDPRQIFPRTRVLARTPTQLTFLRLGDLDRLTSHDPNVHRGYDSYSPRRTYFREPVLAAFRLAASTALKAAVRCSFSSVALRLGLPLNAALLSGRPDVLAQTTKRASRLGCLRHLLGDDTRLSTSAPS